MRTKYSIINAITAVVFQIINILIVFLSRRIFLAELGATCLGINSLFTQMLSMLSLVELGIGQAIVFSLYKPLAENDEEQISAIMQLYRKVYTAVGGIIFLIGAGLTPFIKLFISGDISEINNIYLVFMLYVINTSLTYFSAYKQNLFIADQRKYITIFYHGGLFILTNLFQIVVLLTTHDFIVYLLLQIFFTILENVLLSRKTKKAYPYIEKNKKVIVHAETLQTMKKNVGALMAHKIGGVVVNSTDALIISMCIGIVTVGKYTNYAYVVNAFLTLASQLFGSVTASVGNYNVNNPDEIETIFDHFNYFNFALFGVISVCSFGLFNDFIGVVYGKEMLLESGVVFLMVVRLYVNGMRYSLTTFKSAAGIYYPDRYKPLLESAINLIVSVVLAKKCGLAGVVIGTIACMVLADLTIEPHVVYKYIFHKRSMDYYKKYLLFACAIMVMMPLSYRFSLHTVASFDKMFIKGICLLLISTIYVFMIGWIFCREDLKYFLKLFHRSA